MTKLQNICAKVMRTKISTPTRMLIKRKLIKGDVLHHGSGTATYDTDAMIEVADSVTEHDPNYNNNPEALNKKYDTIVSNYVLNCLVPEERKQVITEISNALKPSGKAFITVRGKGLNRNRVISNIEDGVKTSIGTFQKTYTPQALIDDLKHNFNSIKIIKGKGIGIGIMFITAEVLNKEK